MTSIYIGEALHRNAAEIEMLVAKARADRLRCRNRVQQPDGDTRYWGVSLDESPLLERLDVFGQDLFRKRTGHDAGASLIMINVIDAAKSPTGSGGGWHRDSFTEQYKAFMYLTPVIDTQQGAFCFLPGSNRLGPRALSAAYRVISRGNRYSEPLIDVFVRMGATVQPVLLDAGIPFFVDTSLVHRGMRISRGERIMATQYLFARKPDWFGEFGEG
jgi:hypothetical protein